MINLLFSPSNLPQQAYAICNLCLNLIHNCKITNKVSESFVLILLEKNIRSDQVRYCHVPFKEQKKSAEFPVRAIKFLKWLIYDLYALKLAQPNPWLENINFFE